MCLSSSGSDHFNIRKINYQFFPMAFVSSVPSCLCFPTLPPFFFQDSDFLIEYSFIDGKSLHSFPSMFLSGDSQEDTNEASSYHYSFFFFSGGFKTSFRCWKFSLPRLKCSRMPVYLLIIHFSLFVCSGVLKISQEIRLFVPNPFKISWGCYLIQPILFYRGNLSFKSLQRCFFLVGPNP